MSPVFMGFARPWGRNWGRQLGSSRGDVEIKIAVGGLSRDRGRYDRDVATNRDLVVASIEAIQNGDLDRGLKDWTQDTIFINGAGAVGTEGTWHGPNGFRAWLREAIEGYADYSLDVLDVEEAGETVTVTFRESGRGPASGITVERRVQARYTTRDGKITRVETSVV
jgi:ketosteroid isomerase-like protein